MRAMLQPWLLLYYVGVWAVVAGADGDVVVRDARLDLPLAELLALPLEDAVDLQLQQAIAQCRLRGISGVVQHSRISASPAEEDERGVVYCHRLRYVRHVRMRQRALWTLRKQQLHTETTTPATTVQVADAHDLDYQAFFETFAVVQVPAVLQPRAKESLSSVGLDDDDLRRFLRVCFASNRRVAPLLPDKDECKALLDHFRVPLVAVNSYLSRTNGSEALALHVALLTVSEATSAALSPRQVTCPFGLHTLLVPLTNSVKYTLHNAELTPYEPPVAAAGDDYNEVSVAADSAAASTPSPNLFGGQGDIPLVDAKSPSHSDVLRPDRTLFVPGSAYVATLSGASRVLRFCYVDASNFNFVTESLRVDALVSRIAKALLLELQSPALDTSMARRPEPDDALWPNFLQWPKEPKLRKRREMLSTDSASDHAVPMSRRERLKQWQDDRRWAWHIQSLTLPVPLAPVVLNVTRHSVTLRWQDLYERPKNDITGFGYEVRWRREPNLAEELESGDLSGAVNFTHTHLVRSAMPTTLFGDAFDGKDIEGVVSGLAADSLYSFSVRIYVGDTMGVESEHTPSIKTAPCSVPDRVPGIVTALNASDTCVQLRWLAPADDGGRPVTSFVFAMRQVRAPLEHLTFRDNLLQRSDDERLVTITDAFDVNAVRGGRGIWLSAKVCGQIPAQRVQLRVAAVNTIGMSPWSDASAMLTPRSDTEFSQSTIVPTIRGRGDPAYEATVHLVDTKVAEATAMDSSRPRVIVSDVYETLVIAAPGAAAESHLAVWRGHFSPRRFHVSSELVAADPFDAHAPLRNAAEVRNRVALIARGEVSFLMKILHAQQAGALGVVLVDSSSTCSRGFDQRCVAGSSQSQGRGFGWSDRHPQWRQIVIPFVLASPVDSRHLQELLGDG